MSNSPPETSGRDSLEDTVSLLPTNQFSTSFEISHSHQDHGAYRQDRCHTWPVLWGGAAALTTLCLLSLSSIFLQNTLSNYTEGEPPGTFELQLSAACQRAVTASSFLSEYTPDVYHLHIHLPSSLFHVNLSLGDHGAPRHFNASAAVQLTVTQSARCVLLNAQDMLFWHASLAVVPNTTSQQGQHGQRQQGDEGNQLAAGRNSMTTLCDTQEECMSVVMAAQIDSPTSTVEKDLVAVDLGGTTIQPGSTAVLFLRYTATLGTDSSGLYRSDPFIACPAKQQGSSRHGSEGQQDCPATVLLVTQLEPLGARRLLPCLDGPRFKAHFRVSMQAPWGLTTLSNMPRRPVAGPSSGRRGSDTLNSGAVLDFTPLAKSQEQLAGVDSLQTVEFELTPRMSPYLLAVAVGRLEQLEGTGGAAKDVTLSGSQVRFWAVPGKAGQLGVARQVAVRALDFFEAWTGVQQPLQKFDYVAVPGKGGAMENWGLLLFDERRFLVNEASSGAYATWLAADVVCHETAHQWFGNLATARDWRQLTVNEGVASFMEYKCLEAVLPYLPAQPLLFRATSPAGEAIGIHEGPMLRMLGHETDPFQPPLVPASELWEDDDVVTYSKGAALLHMVEKFMDQHQPGAFQAGFQEYLQRHEDNVGTMAELLGVLADQLSLAPSSTEGASSSGVRAEPLHAGVLSSFVHLTQQYNQLFAAMDSTVTHEYDKLAAQLTAANSLGAWLHRPGYPLVNASCLTAASPLGQSTDGLGATFQIEQRQMTCSWQFLEQLVQELQAAGIQADVNNTFSTCKETFANWWLPYTVPVASSLFACPGGRVAAEGSSSSQSSRGAGRQQVNTGFKFENCSDSQKEGSNGSSVASGLWVMNPEGSGVYRTLYSQQYLHELLSGTANLKPCYFDAAGNLLGTVKQSRSAGRSCMSSSTSDNSLWVTSDECAGTVNGANLNFTASCQLDSAPALAAASIISDVAALAKIGHYPLSAVVQAAVAASQAPLGMTGTGLYLLVLPAFEALLRLQPQAAAYSSGCSQHLEQLAVQLFSQHAQRALRQHWLAPAQQTHQDASLGQLAASRLGWYAALAGDKATSRLLCTALPATPLWHHMSTAAVEQGSSELGCPPGYIAVPSGASGSAEGLAGEGAPTATGASTAESSSSSGGGGDSDSRDSSKESSSSGGSAQLYARSPAGCQRAPAGQTSKGGSSPSAAAGESGTGDPGPPSADVLPAVYIAAAAGPPTCTAAVPALETGTGTVDLVVGGLMRCWEREPDDAEASRCLHALPFSRNITTLRGVLHWLLGSAAAAPRLSTPEPAVPGAECSLPLEVSGWGLASSPHGETQAPKGWTTTTLGGSLSPAALTRLHVRRRALVSKLPILLSSAAQRSEEAWRTTLDMLEDSWQQAAACGLLEQLCLAVEMLPEPLLVEDYTRLRTFLGRLARSSDAPPCPLRTLARALGIARRAQKVAMQQAAELCASLDQN